MRFTLSFLLSLALLISFSCRQAPEKMFEILPSSKTGIEFNNSIIPNEYFNILNYEYIYNGGGIGIGDFNNDSLPDIFFSGNVVPNTLYLNKDNMRFEDVSEESGIMARDRWCTGVAVVDINTDGWQDIYVCASVYNNEKRKNLLFINQGLNGSGLPEFVERAEEYGIADSAFSIHAVFFDYDNDTDLDLYVLTNRVETISPNRYRNKMNNGSSPGNDRLYRNNGNGTFTNATYEADIYYEGYGLGISVQDFNMDGWKDIYITNDYITNDVLLINNQDGSFSNKIRHYIRHQNHSAKGHDVADINNDGLPDIFSLDMVPEDNRLRKSTMLPTEYNEYEMNEKYGYEHQYTRNVLQLNNGPDDFGHHTFSEIALYAGIYATYWSWAPLFVDLDNDGMKDLFISNGFPKDVTDMDYGASRYMQNMAFNKKSLLANIPEIKVENYFYKYENGISFSKMNTEWGITEPSFSNGAATADLDNDGDLDIITNNINAKAFIYKNNRIETGIEGGNYLNISLQGPEENPVGIGSQVILWHEGEQQFIEFSPYRGYMSSIEQEIHFGLGTITSIDSVIVIWPDRKKSFLGKTTVNKKIFINYSEADRHIDDRKTPKPKYLFEAGDSLNIRFKHKETKFNDFNIQLTIPHQFSQYGPSISAGDINGDNKTDFFLGGSLGIGGTFYLQEKTSFRKKYFQSDHNKNQEDLGTLLFDADNDGDLDLYIVSGGYEQEISDQSCKDRFYRNDGKGNFEIVEDALPDFHVSGSCVKAADYDQDGDLDLFIGGCLDPGNYPMPVSSYLLENRSDDQRISFANVSSEDCPDLEKIGMVMDALWTDFNNDNWIDLIVVGEWMPVTFFENRNGKLYDITGASGIQQYSGWWRSITGADFDHDGDTDYVLGNLGENTRFKASPDRPVVAYADDYDNNGISDIIIGNYRVNEKGEKLLYPIHSRDDLLKQVPVFKDRFNSYAEYGQATLEDLFTKKELVDSYRLEATWMSSSYMENLGNNTFKLSKLPPEAQFAPIYGSLVHDLNGDGYADILLVGNDYGNNPYWGRYDAFNGLILLNQRASSEERSWKVVQYPASGFFVGGDAKALVSFPLSDHESLILASQNQDSLRVFTIRHDKKAIRVSPMAAKAILFKKNKKTKVEFYYGSSFLSQSSRTLYIPETLDSLIVYDYSGSIIKQ